MAKNVSVSNRRKNSNLKKIPGNKLLSDAKDYYDYNLLAAVVLLICFGLVMLYSTSAYESSIKKGRDMFYFGKQAAISCVSFVGVLIGSQFDYHWYAKHAHNIYWFAMVLLYATKFIGRTLNGARRWIYIGPISFQAAEFAKLAIILFLPVAIVKIGKNMRGLKAPCTVAAYGLIAFIGAYQFTDNLSTAIIIAGITAGLIFLVHPATKRMVGLFAGLGGAIGILVYLFIQNISSFGESFRLNRILVWLNPQDYLKSGGYQVMQGLYAIGSGGFFGKGLGNSTQKLGALPEAQNDMIFSIICEELGVFGAAMVILLFVFLLYRLFFIARNAPDLLGSLIASGVFIHISLQLIFNIAVVINLIPTTGITLPFVSYGGTSLLFLMGEMTLALSISKQIQFK